MEYNLMMAFQLYFPMYYDDADLIKLSKDKSGLIFLLKNRLIGMFKLSENNASVSFYASRDYKLEEEFM